MGKDDGKNSKVPCHILIGLDVESNRAGEWGRGRSEAGNGESVMPSVPLGA